MKHTVIVFLAAIMTVFITVTTVYADDKENYFAPFIGGGYIPDDKPIYLKLKSGFDFLNNSSGVMNWELALTGAVLSDEIYYITNSSESARSDIDIKDTMKALGYTKIKACYQNEVWSYKHPSSCLGYGQYIDNGNIKNIFVIVVRGTHSAADIYTDIESGGKEFFESAINSVCADFIVYAENVTGKKIKDLQKEDNYFFITGHSLGGAVANGLSVTDTIFNLAGRDKNKIYTYTFEAPHTCTSNWLVNTVAAPYFLQTAPRTYMKNWFINPKKVSNAFNFKDVDDSVPNMPPWASATRYGTDLEFSVKDLDNDIFTTLFPKAIGGSVTEAPKRKKFGWDHFFGGHHDMGIPLTYILQKGIEEKTWESIEDVLQISGDSADKSSITSEIDESQVNTYGYTKEELERFKAGYRAAIRYPEGKVEKIEPINFDTFLTSASIYWSVYADEYGNGTEIIDCGDYYEVTNCIITYPYVIPDEIFEQFEEGYEFDLSLYDQNGNVDTIHNVVSYQNGDWILSDDGNPEDGDGRYIQTESSGKRVIKSYEDDRICGGAIYRGSLFFRKDCIVHDTHFVESETFEEYVTKEHAWYGETWFQGGKTSNYTIEFSGKVIFDIDTGMIVECQEIYQV